MSERERWIVYPLLFLTLGMAMRDKFGKTQQVSAHRVVCDQMVVRDENERPQVVLESTKAGGVVRAINSESTMELVLGHEDQASSLFREVATGAGIKNRAVLGDLRLTLPQMLLDRSEHWPLFDPRLHQSASPPEPSSSNAK